MTIKNLVFENTYRDSVVLMRIAQKIELLDGVEQATAMMSTENNLLLMREAGLLSGPHDGLTPNDIVVAMRLSSPDHESEVTAQVRELLTATPRGATTGSEIRPRSLDAGSIAMPDANLALISVPGQYAAYEAEKALDKGLHVLMFSDNVPIEDEVALKRRAQDRGLFMFGPDCGTAVINGTPLGFANAVPQGRVGLVSASGTGLQHVMCLLADQGEGVSQALGVGGRDLDDRVGGLMTLEGLSALETDPQTEIVVLVSKPPGAATRDRIIDALKGYSKPCVVCFFEANSGDADSPNLYMESTLEDAANRTLELLGVPIAPRSATLSEQHNLDALSTALPDGPRYIRGLYSGGTLCYEALHLLRQYDGPEIHSNLSMDGISDLQPGDTTEGHVMIDLGDDLYTVGRPHPMIDFRQRCEMLVEEAHNPEVGVLLVDVVLGYGAHADPAAELAPAIREALRVASSGGRSLACVAVLCGTEGDPQSRDRQRAELAEAGAIVVSSNVQGLKIAAALSLGDLSLVKELF